MTLVRHYKTIGLFLLALSVAFALALYSNVEANHARHHAACVTDQRLYAGFFRYTEFLGHEFHATPAQLKAGLADLRVTLGPPPPICR